MSEIKVKYQSAAQSFTISLNSLAGGSYVTGTAVDNTSDLFLDVMIEITIADITEAGQKQVLVYAISSVDGTNYSDNQTANLLAFRLLGSMSMNGSGPWRSPAMSLAQAFGGFVPPKWNLVVHNDNSSTALAGSGNSIQYRGIYYQNV